MSIISFIGGPGGGKTPATVDVAQAIRQEGRRCLIVRETAGSMFRDGLNHDDISDQAKADILQRQIFNKQLQGENSYLALCQGIGCADPLEYLVLCDRGLWDGRAYVPERLFLAYEASHNLIHCRGLYRYRGLIHVVTTADGVPEHYETKTEDGRNESPERARELDKLTLEAYIGHPRISIVHNIVNGQKIGFEEKKQHILQAVRALLGTGEQKVVRYGLPDFTAGKLAGHCGKIVEQSVQTQFMQNGAVYEEIHMAEAGKNHILHTKDDMLVSRSEYSAAIAKKQCRKTVHCTRYLFAHDYQYVRIDESDEGTFFQVVQRHAFEQPVICPEFLGEAVLQEAA